ncbi:hypothetical protein [Amycolatopsis sp. NPDC057786]|uniref:hypothetical protein n=1 Tax=Amycolatopsis sp. NPDC057786 TaxID=3346250 RepID=UPI00366F7163
MSAIVVAVIAAVASVSAAVVAGMFALAARRLEARVQSADQVRERISEQKRAMCEPVVDMLDRMFTSDDLPTEEELKHKRRFDTWVNVYGSDGIVRAYSRLMQALPAGAPADIQFRLYADFLIEVRKDIGDPGTAVDRMQILGPRSANLSDRRSLTDPDLNTVCKRLGWVPPWRAK